MYKILVTVGSKTVRFHTNKFEINGTVLKFKDTQTSKSIIACGNWYVEEVNP